MLKSFISGLTAFISFLFFAVGIVSLISAISAFLERQQFGKGVMFADFEVLLVIAVIFSAVGFVFIFIHKALIKGMNIKSDKN